MDPPAHSAADFPEMLPPPVLRPLGFPPAPKSYAGLVAISAGGILLALAVAGLHLRASQEGFSFPVPDTLRQLLLSPPSDRLTTLLESLLGVLVALLGLRSALDLRRLDRRAAWIVWRAGARAESPGLGFRGRVRFALPFGLAGVLVAAVSLAALLEAEPAPRLDVLPVGPAWGLVLGVLLVLGGVAVSEVRRFLWRMEDLGHALLDRPRGQEVSIGAVRVGSGESQACMAPFFTNLLLWTTGLVCVLVTWKELSAWHTRAPAPPEARLFFVVLNLTACAGLMGGLVVLHRLSIAWAQMLFEWEDMGATTGLLEPPGFGQRAARVFFWIAVSAAAVSGLLGLGLLAHRLQWENDFEPMAWWTLVLLSAALALACGALWLAQLKQETTRFMRAASAAAGDPAPRGRNHLAPLVLAVLTLALAAAVLLAEANALVQAGISLRKNGLGLPELLPHLTWRLIGWVTLLLPSAGLALVALDLDRAANFLEACVEVRPADAGGGQP